MIPKKIHYCWFGGKPKPQSVLNYIESWRRFCPNYEIIEWNEDNFNISDNIYCKEAYDSKKWAFVSDVARLSALYQEGGIYLDTDVEVKKSLDDLLDNKGFFGFEVPIYVGTNIIGACKGNEFIKSLLNDYDERRFIKLDGDLDTTTNVEVTTKLAKEMGLALNGQQQTINGVTFYPQEYFCPYDYTTGRMTKSKLTYSIHWYNQTWISPKNRRRLKITKVFRRVFGPNIFNWLR
jgi:mannosyltransferase OCH1-like enzyme